MIKVKLDTGDLKRITNKLERASDRVRQEASVEIHKSAYKIRSDAIRVVPVDLGVLKNSIRVDIKNLSANIGTNVHYAPYVEFGTVKQSAQPYLFPAFERERPKLIKRLKDLLKIK